eukprot:360853-Hanusia_phi.AAC.1
MEKDLVEKAEKHGRDLVMKLVGRLHRATEELKAAGMPGNESSRLNQVTWEGARERGSEGG